MSPKQYARYLHQECGLDYDEACRMSGYSPSDDYRSEALRVFFALATGAALTAIVIVGIPAVLT